MQILYDLLVRCSYFLVWMARGFSKKLQKFVRGRRDVFITLADAITPTDQTIWFHCASLGEFEQGLPIMEAVKERFSRYKIVVTFFSPSGYEIKKDTPIASVVTYLPIDTSQHAEKFIQMVHPSLAIFVKYEVWPNYLRALQQQHIPSLLVSSLFRKEQIYFKFYGGFLRKALRSFDHVFVQDETSKELLQQIGVGKVTISGDTRFDRVSQQLERNNNLSFADAFIQGSLCIVCGSTWPEDEAVLTGYMNMAPPHVKFIVAPHIVEGLKIEGFRRKLTKKTILFSEITSQRPSMMRQLTEASVLIIDTIGLLSRIYNYADIAYVGGAMGTTGLHNILEPATFKVPVVIGSNYGKFPEAKRLKDMGGLFTVKNAMECTAILEKLVFEAALRKEAGSIAGNFITTNTGATSRTMDYIEKLLLN